MMWLPPYRGVSRNTHRKAARHGRPLLVEANLKLEHLVEKAIQDCWARRPAFPVPDDVRALMARLAKDRG